MEIDYTFSFWENVIALSGVVIGFFTAFWIYRLSKQLSAREKYNHEIKITKVIKELKIYGSVILADVKKYHPLRTDSTNRTYYKQGAELYKIVPEFGVQFILRPHDESIPVGLVPFQWIEYIRDHDSEDNKPIVVCEFKGIRWFKKFKSPFTDITYVYKNPYYKPGLDPDFMEFTPFKPNKPRADKE